jgi:hypothetical protein
MFPNNSLFGGLARVIVILVIIGFLAGLALAGSDMVNFITNSAKSQAIKNQNDLQAKKDAVDIKNYAAVQAAHTQNEIDQANADNAAHERSLEQDLQFQAQKGAQALEMSRTLGYAGIGAGMFLAICAGIGVIIQTSLTGRSRLIIAQARARQAEPWQDLLWRNQQIKRSREFAHMQRKQFVDNAFLNTPPFYSGKTSIPWNSYAQQYREDKSR